MGRKGFVRTLEGALGMFVLMMFLFYVVPHVSPGDQVSESSRNFVYLALEDLDNSGFLDGYLVGDVSNLSALESALNRTIPQDLGFAVGVVKVNASYGDVFSGEDYAGANISYNVNNTYFKGAYVVLGFVNATNPRVRFKGEEIFSYAGAHPGSPVRLDVTESAVAGVNDIEVKTLNNATVGYVVIVDNEEILSAVPVDRAVGVVTYMLSGKEGWFQPTVAEVYLWK